MGYRYKFYQCPNFCLFIVKISKSIVCIKMYIYSKSCDFWERLHPAIKSYMAFHSNRCFRCKTPNICTIQISLGETFLDLLIIDYRITIITRMIDICLDPPTNTHSGHTWSTRGHLDTTTLNGDVIEALPTPIYLRCFL